MLSIGSLQFIPSHHHNLPHKSGGSSTLTQTRTDIHNSYPSGSSIPIETRYKSHKTSNSPSTSPAPALSAPALSNFGTIDESIELDSDHKQQRKSTNLELPNMNDNITSLSTIQDTVSKAEMDHQRRSTNLEIPNMNDNLTSLSTIHDVNSVSKTETDHHVHRRKFSIIDKSDDDDDSDGFDPRQLNPVHLRDNNTENTDIMLDEMWADTVNDGEISPSPQGIYI